MKTARRTPRCCLPCVSQCFTPPSCTENVYFLHRSRTASRMCSTQGCAWLSDMWTLYFITIEPHQSPMFARLFCQAVCSGKECLVARPALSSSTACSLAWYDVCLFAQYPIRLFAYGSVKPSAQIKTKHH